MSQTTAAARDQSFHLHPATNLRTVQKEGPLVITRVEGVYVYGDEGRRYLEGMSGLWCASLGFSERRLAEAAYRQMRELPFYHSFAGKVPAISTELAERLIRLAPAGMGKVLFANSGSEANDAAIKLVWYINNALGRPQKKKIISRKRAYHGVTVAAASLTGLAFAHDDFDLPIARTGNMFGAQTFNLQPDIMTLAKALSAGYQPISASLLTDDLYDVLLAQSDKLGIFGHGYTYSAHPVPAAVALETLKIYGERDIVAHVNRVGPRLQAGIRSYADHPLIGDARGIGLIGAVEIVRDKTTKQSFEP